ncbi:predicted protein [Plenodomus lingam JN3]|uniref:Predicted protein n=1 Tax=Leptosphaeria maculans (strain JN3 / isolate v23.1.3 / race Av1-4-5-6-7-8) TaxID=985895 RepID=E4ZSQ5_LEPMJ|nr:predicted protein [Plenodomus lingam JN3]CBX94435.1 predicted protein [Plenodomus lingam JN3]
MFTTAGCSEAAGVRRLSLRALQRYQKTGRYQSQTERLSTGQDEQATGVRLLEEGLCEKANGRPLNRSSEASMGGQK